MAPLPESRKRAGSSIEVNEHDQKRQKRHYHHVHSTHTKQSSANPYPLNDPLSIQNQLRRSIALVLHTVGFSDATPEALETFTSATEEYMVNLLSYVRMAMEAGKRTQATPFDFEYALNANHLTLRSLIPHLDPPTSDKTEASKERVAPKMEGEEVAVDKDEQLIEQFSIGLRGPQAQTRLSYAGRKLPILPSRHTYKATPTPSNRATDPKSIREKATEESRLAEEALRRLVSEGRDKGKGLSTGHEREAAQSSYQKFWDMLVEQEQEDEDRADLKRTDFSGPPVNAESRYWRKSIRPSKKAAAVISVGGRDPG